MIKYMYQILVVSLCAFVSSTKANENLLETASAGFLKSDIFYIGNRASIAAYLTYDNEAHKILLNYGTTTVSDGRKLDDSCVLQDNIQVGEKGLYHCMDPEGNQLWLLVHKFEKIQNRFCWVIIPFNINDEYEIRRPSFIIAKNNEPGMNEVEIPSYLNISTVLKNVSIAMWQRGNPVRLDQSADLDKISISSERLNKVYFSAMLNSNYFVSGTIILDDEGRLNAQNFSIVDNRTNTNK